MQFIKSIIALVGAGLLLLACNAPATTNEPTPAQSTNAPLKALLVEYTDKGTGAIGAGDLLRQAGFAVEPLALKAPPETLAADLIVLGSFCSENPQYQSFMRGNAAKLTEFVRRGGVLLQLIQADEFEKKPPFLTNGLAVQRTDFDSPDLLVKAPDHLLLAGLPLQRLDNPPGSNQVLILRGLRGPNWESFERQKGFRVLIASDENNQYPALLEAGLGRGRVLLAAVAPDKLFNADTGKLLVPEESRRIVERFFVNLAEYTRLVRNGAAPKVEPTPACTAGYPPPLPFVAGSWTLAVLPDTQNLSLNIFESQTKWIAENARERNIVYALQLGDIVNASTSNRWAVARAALERLDGVVPYALATGNHDYHGKRALFNEYFPVAKFEKWPTFGGVFETGRMDNCWHQFQAGGRNWIIVALKWSPSDAAVAWADRVLTEHPDHKAIIITHAYLYSDDTRYDWAKKGNTQAWSPHSPGSNDGEELWQKLVRRHANVVMVLNGHVLYDGLGYLASRGDHGNLVHQMLVNYQMIGGGWMRLIEFLPDGRTVQVKAYSPSLNRYRTDRQNQFVFDLDPPLDEE